jgi:hypothetical protein
MVMRMRREKWMMMKLVNMSVSPMDFTEQEPWCGDKGKLIFWLGAELRRVVGELLRMTRAASSLSELKATVLSDLQPAYKLLLQMLGQVWDVNGLEELIIVAWCQEEDVSEEDKISDLGDRILLRRP